MDKVVVFDTTLRDGEQAPGMSMGPVAKLRIARKLTDLRVDVIEAGFPASSETDAEAVNKIARELGVEYLLTATVQVGDRTLRREKRITVTAR